MNERILFIHTKLDIGGVETFFTRLNSDLLRKGMVPTFLIMDDDYHDEIFRKIVEKSEVIFLKNIVHCGKLLGNFSKILFPLKKKKIIDLYKNIDVIHVGNLRQYFFAKRIAVILKKPLKIIFGVYHSNELAWSINEKKPFFEKIFRNDLFFSGASIYFPNEFSKKITLLKNNLSPSEINSFVFPIGVVGDKDIKKVGSENRGVFRICSVGRLVEFKTYNIHVINAIHELNKRGYNVIYDIYGDGPSALVIENLIDNLGLNNVFLKGSFNYGEFDNVVSIYDCFIGSGTALVQAASIGVPCIIGIENEQEGLTYGLFSEIEGIDYHEQDLELNKNPIVDVLEYIHRMKYEEYDELSKKHHIKAQEFSMNKFISNFSKMIFDSISISFNRSGYFIFIFIFIFELFFLRIIKKFNYSDKYQMKLRAANTTSS